MEDQLATLSLDLNASVPCTTKYTDAAVAQFRDESHKFRDEDAARLTPLKHHNMNPSAATGFTATMPVDDLVEVVGRAALLFTCELGVGNGPAQPAVALEVAGQDQQVRPSGSGMPACGADSPNNSAAPAPARIPSSRTATAKRTAPYMPPWPVSMNTSSPSRTASSTRASGELTPSKSVKYE